MSEQRAKYGNRKTVRDGITFDSIAEARRYEQLVLLQKAGKISNLDLQPIFELHPAIRDRWGNRHRSILYIGDFTYQENGMYVVEDVKGAQTEVFRLKRKLFAAKYPDIELRIIGGSL